MNELARLQAAYQKQKKQVTLDKIDILSMIQESINTQDDKWLCQNLKRLDCLEVWGGKIVC